MYVWLHFRPQGPHPGTGRVHYDIRVISTHATRAAANPDSADAAAAAAAPAKTHCLKDTQQQ